MKMIRTILAFGAALALSACASANVSRDALPGAVLDAPAAAAVPPAGIPQVDIARIDVDVPATLVVSEANSYKPRGDIVWHGDPAGDRYAQVRDLIASAMETGTASLQGPRSAVLEVTVHRFHAVTPKTYYTIGGWHEIEMDIRLRDLDTGAILMPSHRVSVNFRSLHGAAALEAEAKGLTQKVRIVNHLAGVIRAELATPEFYVAGL